MKEEQTRLVKGRDFGTNSVETIFKSDLYMQRKMPSEPDKPKTLVVALTTDKGLWGSINSKIIREVSKYIGHDLGRHKLLVIGDKGAAAFRRPYSEIFVESIMGITTPVSYGTSLAVASKVMELSDQCDKIAIIYSHFKSAVVFTSTVNEVMSK